jgi:Ca2+:H+ antiporter
MNTDDESHTRASPEMTLLTQARAIICSSWLNILLLAVPAGFALNYINANGIASFCTNFVAMIPLAGMLGYATEQVPHYLGELLGGLLVATFG